MDTSAFIGGFRPSPEYKNYTTQGVFDEVKDSGTKLKAELYVEGGVTILEPSSESMREVENVSRKTGDYVSMSETDLKVLALALDVKKRGDEAVIVTDDYQIQNLSNELEIPFLPVIEVGIKEAFEWKVICRGCNKEFPAEYNKTECDVCGSRVKKIVSSKRRL